MEFTFPDIDPRMTQAAAVANCQRDAARAYTRSGQHREAARATRAAEYAESVYYRRGLALMERDDA